ncbi:hypothetical protein P7D22_06740 [Lichenihabitans sp. Uapishka_5]|uniref:hypothetical protein n=1 Tax=Lichenihabitans sp. Uapishka_5 TaxID=3037302 RepID=UPI0029E81D7E|nr:hypothetical protein [Lichenihabitans sp. Uapishka_5]MDX7950874.1 hypothetical protein [Lichenihabitans sp. Uapishka_5]
MPLRRPSLIHCFAWATLTCLGVASAWAEDAAPDATKVAAAVQVMADLTLIDSACHGEAVNFGIALGFLARQGVSTTSVLPGGSERAAFEHDVQTRRASFDHDALCGEIADNYAEALPGSVTLPTGTIRGR